MPERLPGSNTVRGMLDAAAGLYYVRARWYDPALGRFLSEDPIGLAGGINNYAYAANDPVNLGDPMGLAPCAVEWGGWEGGITITSMEGGCDSGFWSHRNWAHDPNARDDGGYFGILHFRNIGRLGEDVTAVREAMASGRPEEVRLNAHAEFPGEANSDDRHACGSYVLTQEFGEWPTRLLGIGNEAQGFLRWDLWRLRSRIEGRSAWAFQPSDLLANEVGIFGATRGYPAMQCDRVR